MLRRVAEWITATVRDSDPERKLRWVQFHLMV
jgi:hypothetical protein